MGHIKCYKYVLYVSSSNNFKAKGIERWDMSSVKETKKMFNGADKIPDSNKYKIYKSWATEQKNTDFTKNYGPDSDEQWSAIQEPTSSVTTNTPATTTSKEDCCLKFLVY